MQMDGINIRKTFDAEMRQLEADLLKLASLAEDAVLRGVWALKEQDVQLAREIIDNDDAIDELTSAIDGRCLSIIARFQPVALDLRTISSVLHMAVDLERIADYGVSIARAAIRLADERLIKALISIPMMADLLKKMIDAALAAFLERDAQKAREICRMDDGMDDIEEQVFRELLLIMMENPRNIPQAMELLFIARTLERAGDHATNLAERIIYVATGKHEKSSAHRRPLEE